MLTQELGAPTGNPRSDIDALYDYIACLKEQLDYDHSHLLRRVGQLEKEVRDRE